MPFPPIDPQDMLNTYAYLFDTLAPYFMVFAGICLGIGLAQVIWRKFHLAKPRPQIVGLIPYESSEDEVNHGQVA